MSLVLRNATDIHVLTANNLSEAGWNIQHAFSIWAYTDYFGSLKTPLMSVFGVRKDFLDVNTPKTSISAAGHSLLYGTKSRADNSKTKNARVVFLVHDTLSQCDACTRKVS